MSDNRDKMELISPNQPGFVDRVTPKKPDDLMMLQCQKEKPRQPNDPAPADPDYPGNIELGPHRTAQRPAPPKNICGGVHFRHAGYVHNMLPFMRSNQEKKVELVNYQVMVCVKCRSSYIWAYDQLYDISEKIDLEAWEKVEKELHKATGPGGQC